ncbi:MAG TPA: leucyl aminopeptidase [Thermoanaerobaculia bacterium]|jgi:leucyl aminopeptidase
MQVHISRDPQLSSLDHLFVLLSEEHRDLPLPPEVRQAIEAARFEGRGDESITILSGEPRKLTLIGLGKPGKLTIRSLRTALTTAGRTARKQRDANIAVLLPHLLPELDASRTTRVAADYLGAADYKYDAYLTPDKDEPKRPTITATLIAHPDLDDARIAALEAEVTAIATAIRTVRDLANGPSNIITPTALANRAEEVAKEVGIKCTVYGREDIVRMKMGGLIAVNRGSIEEPRFVVMEYTPKQEARKHVALVGKGITFDSGGISIKPADRMEEMKFDMCGAAAVIGIIEAAARLELPVKITSIFASTDNLPSGSAYKPGEIITMMNGKTVEIVNTDAEGRMILGDALHYASNLKPDHILDFATLTGACVVALGSEAAGLFANDDELARKLIDCGERVGDRVWRLPLWDEYKEGIRSEWADMKNSGGRWGGALTAAVFLKEFVDCPSWAHLDIAGTAYAESETARDGRGSTGAGVRVTLEFLESLSRS